MKCGCCTVIFITATSGSHRAAGSPSTRKAWLVSAPTTAPTHYATRLCPRLVHNESRLLTNAAILADLLAIDLSRVLAFTYAYACLNASWWFLSSGSGRYRTVASQSCCDYRAAHRVIVKHKRVINWVRADFVPIL